MKTDFALKQIISQTKISIVLRDSDSNMIHCPFFYAVKRSYCLNFNLKGYDFGSINRSEERRVGTECLRLVSICWVAVFFK